MLGGLRRAKQLDVALRIGGVGEGNPYLHSVVGMEHADRVFELGSCGPGQGEGAFNFAGIDIDKLFKGIDAHVPRAAGSAGPRVLVIDDLGELTPSTARALLAIGERGRTWGWRTALIADSDQHTLGHVPEGVTHRYLGALPIADLVLALREAVKTLVAVDVAERLYLWSAGNPGIAIALADDLSDAQLAGSEPWHGPVEVPPIARRAYRSALASLSADSQRVLGEELVRAISSGASYLTLTDAAPTELLGCSLASREGGRWVFPHPLAAVLALESLEAPSADSASERLFTSDTRVDPDARERAMCFARALMEGRPGQDTEPESLFDGGAAKGWSDHLWWTQSEHVEPELSEAGRRLAVRLIDAESATPSHAPHEVLPDVMAIIAGPSVAPHATYLLTRLLLTAGIAPRPVS